MANLELLNTIKGLFTSGATPSQTDFEKLIDATANATIINSGVVDVAHLPSNIDLTQQAESSSVSAHIFMGDGGQLNNLNASHITSGTINTQRLPNDIDLTLANEPTSISADVLHCDAIQTGSANAQTITTEVIHTELNTGESVEMLAFNPESGQISVAVKQDGEFIQDEIANKRWVNTKISSQVADHNNQVNDNIAGVSNTVDALSNQLIVEQTRAINAEEDLSRALLDELTARETADTQIEGKLNIQTQRIDDILGSAGADADSFSEIVTLINSIDTSSDDSLSALSTRVNVNQQSIINVENNAENLSHAINQVDLNLTTEVQRAETAEASLLTSINIQNQNLAAIEHDLQNSINAEAIRAQTEESNLNNLIITQSESINGQQGSLNTINNLIRANNNNVELGKADASGPIIIKGDCTAQNNLWVNQSIVPSPGNTPANGINFHNDIGGGTHDAAWIRHYASEGENTLLEFGISNDADDHIIFNASGNVGINTHSPAAKFHVNGDALANAWNISSDVRLKENIQTLQDPISIINAIHGVSFDWQNNKRNREEGSQIGVIAQEIEAVLPQLVSEDTNGYKSVDYSKLVAPLIEAVKHLNAKVEDQGLQIKSLLRKS
ncbi:tail fiber domain-containing protein [Pseudomonas sp. HK3]